MSYTISFSPFSRFAEAGLRGVRALLVMVGTVSVIGFAHLFAGNAHLSDWLRPLLTLSSAAPEVEREAIDEADEAPAHKLTPRMQAALDYASRRYRVSADALRPIFAVAEESAREWRLDPMLIVAVIAVESRFNPLSESVMGAQGLMQIIPRFHKEKLPADSGKVALLDPLINVRVGAQALHEYIRRNGSVVAGLQQFAGASDDAEQGYSGRVLAEKERMESAARRRATNEG